MITTKRYRIIEDIGSGGIGTVFKALDLLRQEVVALKVLSHFEPESIERFKAEFVLLKGLSHPNITQVFDFGFTEKHQPYFVMEYVETIPWEEFWRHSDQSKLHTFLFQVLSTLDFLHSKKIIHGDIKPSNILIEASPKEQPIVKFTDFGFADYEKDQEVSRWKGTLRYLAPEIIRGERHTPQADLYSLGILIYESIFGEPPFDEKNPMELARSHLENDVPFPEQPVILPEFRNLILRLLHKDPIDRFSSARQVLNEAKEVLGLPLERTEVVLAKSLIDSGDFVGREKELNALQEALTQVARKGSASVLITGEPGIGKARLIEEFTIGAQAQGFSAVNISIREAKSVEAFQNNPTQFLEMSSHTQVLTFRYLESANDSFFRFLSDFTTEVREDKVLVCFTLTTDSACPKRDERLLEIEKRLQAIYGESITPIRLDRLTAKETGSLVSSVFGWREETEKIAEAIHQETGGNPLLIGQFVESLVEEGVIQKEKDKWLIDLERVEKSETPQNLRNEIEGRLPRLKPESKELLACASVWGLETDLDVLRQLSGLDETSVLSCLYDILSHGLMEQMSTLDERKFRLANNLVRRFIYARIDPEKKTALHQKAGEILEAKTDRRKEEDVYELANHFYDAGDVKRAFKYALLAAERAESKVDRVQAVTHLNHALELHAQIPVELLPPKEELLLRLADQLDLMGKYDKSLAFYQEAEQTLGLKNSNPEKKGLIHRKMGRIYDKIGEHDKASAYLEKSAEEFRTDRSPKDYALTLLDLGWVHMRVSDHDRAKSRFAEALHMLQKESLLEEMGFALSGLGSLHWALGDYSQANTYYQKSLKIFQKTGNLKKVSDCYGNLALLVRNQGEARKAIEYFRKCLDILQTLHDQYRLAITYGNLGLVYLDLSLWAEALEWLAKACQLQEGISDLVGLGFSHNNIGLIHLRRGELSQAREYFNTAIVHFQNARHKSGLALVYHNLGDLYAIREELDQALRYTNQSLKIREERGEESGIADCLFLLGKVFLKRQAFDQAKQNLAQAQRHYQKLGNKKAEGEVLISLTELSIRNNALTETERYLSQAEEIIPQVENQFLQGIFQRAKGSFFKAIGAWNLSLKSLTGGAESFRRLQAKCELALTYLEIGKIKLETGRYKEATGFLAEALKMFEKAKIETKKKEVESLLEQIKDFKTLENERIATFYQLAELLNNIWDADELLARSLALAINLLNAERGAILFYSDKDKSFEVKVSEGIEQETSQDAIHISRQVLKDVVKTDLPLIVEDARNDLRFAHSQSVIMHNILSILCVPLKTKNRLIGTVYLDHRSLPAMFSSEDVEFLKAFANLIATAIEKSELYVKANEEIFQLKEVLHRTYEYPGIIGKSAKMQEVFNLVEKVANTRTGVLILGENGTGKELIANLIHERSQRRDGAFIKVNCAALPETLLESELFGIEEKTATGVGFRKGKFELADDGTVFLDEIGDMNLSVQAKVLRAIEEKEFERVGGQKPVKVDVRIISATNMDLQKKIEEGSFRKDLYFRLNPIVVAIPPLRERKEDIPFLVDYFVSRFSKENDKPLLRLTGRIVEALRDYSWPGNVRELQHLIESATLLSEEGTFPEKLLPREIGKSKTLVNLDRYGKLEEVLDWVEKKKIMHTLEKNGWNQSRTAQELGISEPKLRRRMKKLKIKKTPRIRSS